MNKLDEMVILANTTTGKVQQVFDDVAKLPRRQQNKIVEFVSAFVWQYEQGRQ